MQQRLWDAEKRGTDEAPPAQTLNPNKPNRKHAHLCALTHSLAHSLKITHSLTRAHTRAHSLTHRVEYQHTQHASVTPAFPVLLVRKH